MLTFNGDFVDFNYSTKVVAEVLKVAGDDVVSTIGRVELVVAVSVLLYVPVVEWGIKLHI